MTKFGEKYINSVTFLGRVSTADKVKALMRILLHEEEQHLFHQLSPMDWRKLQGIHQCIGSSCLTDCDSMPSVCEC